MLVDAFEERFPDIGSDFLAARWVKLIIVALPVSHPFRSVFQ